MWAITANGAVFAVAMSLQKPIKLLYRDHNFCCKPQFRTIHTPAAWCDGRWFIYKPLNLQVLIWF